MCIRYRVWRIRRALYNFQIVEVQHLELEHFSTEIRESFGNDVIISIKFIGSMVALTLNIAKTMRNLATFGNSVSGRVKLSVTPELVRSALGGDPQFTTHNNNNSAIRRPRKNGRIRNRERGIHAAMFV